MDNKTLLKSLEQIEAALEKIACLGNGRAWGNSEGNCIAQGALIHLDPLIKQLRLYSNSHIEVPLSIGGDRLNPDQLITYNKPHGGGYFRKITDFAGGK